MQLAVQTPCQQPWSEMLPDETGRFCGSCQNTVVDFTSMTDPQLLAYFQTRNMVVCGRFRNDQLSRNLVNTTSLPLRSARQRWMGLLAAGLLSWRAAHGQSTSGNAPQTEQTAHNSAHEKYPATPSQLTISPDSVQVISGRVVDTAGRPVQGASVFAREIQRGANTDAAGNFSIKLADYQAENYVLVFGAIGYIRQEITRRTTDLQFVRVTLAEDKAALGEVITVGYPVVKKPTIFQKIKKRFR